MKNIRSSGWMFVCDYIFTSKSAGKLLRESVSDSVKHEVASSPEHRNIKYSVLDIIKGKLWRI